MKFKRKDLDAGWGIKLDKDLSYEIVVPNNPKFAILYPLLLLTSFIVGAVAIPFILYKSFANVSGDALSKQDAKRRKDE